ncbi:hypothetical protein [Streptomyces sp. NPDC020141]|uniref:hypothetical protein n=1 Tax=Streptomyces sp. NPDC020141 TaxID=3365065 RepID=UPI00378A972B
MSSETDTTHVDPKQLPASSFTDSDLARIGLVNSAAENSRRLVEYALMVGEDQAQAGDYVQQAKVVYANDSLMGDAVIAERVRGTSWEVIAEAAGVTAEEAEQKWGGTERRWRRATPVTSVHRKDPGFFAARADEYITTDKPRVHAAVRRPLSASLDAATHLTGRDVAAADRAFAGAPVCPSCSH